MEYSGDVAGGIMYILWGGMNIHGCIWQLEFLLLYSFTLTLSRWTKQLESVGEELRLVGNLEPRCLILEWGLDCYALLLLLEEGISRWWGVVFLMFTSSTIYNKWFIVEFWYCVLIRCLHWPCLGDLSGVDATPWQCCSWSVCWPCRGLRCWGLGGFEGMGTWWRKHSMNGGDLIDWGTI